MWKALYNYKGSYDGCLTFTKEERFILLRQEDDYWHLVYSINQNKTGCVPVNYIGKIEKVDVGEEVRCIDKAIICLQGTNTVKKKKDLIRKLSETRSEVMLKTYAHKTQPVVNVVDGGSNHVDSATCSTPGTVDNDDTTGRLAFRLVDMVREHTAASHFECSRTVEAMLGELAPHLTAEGPARSLVEDVRMRVHSLTAEEGSYRKSSDWMRMNELLDFFETRKNDNQERSWSLHEDDAVIEKKLQELLAIMRYANHAVCAARLRHESYHSLICLIEFYQMEKRYSVREVLIEIFAAGCEVDPHVVRVLFASVLPLELVRDISDETIEKSHFCRSTLLLTILLSSREELPVDVSEKLNGSFILHLLRRMEVLGDSVVDVCAGLILALNGYLSHGRDNLILKVLLDNRAVAKPFAEHLVHAFNRDVDPAVVLDNVRPECNSVRKFLCDVFASESTASLMYTNDIDVILEVIHRQLCDLAPDSPAMKEYLILLDLLVSQPSYSQRRYKESDLRRRLELLQKEEDLEKSDVYLCQSVMARLHV